MIHHPGLLQFQFIRKKMKKDTPDYRHRPIILQIDQQANDTLVRLSFSHP